MTPTLIINTTPKLTTQYKIESKMSDKPDFSKFPWSRYTHPEREVAKNNEAFRPDCYPGSNTSDTSARIYGTHFPMREYSTQGYLKNFNANRTPPKEDRAGGWTTIAAGRYGRYAPYDSTKHPKRWQ